MIVSALVCSFPPGLREMSSYLATDQRTFVSFDRPENFRFVPGFVLFVFLSGNLTIFTFGHMEILIIETLAQLLVRLTSLPVIQLRATTVEGLTVIVRVQFQGVDGTVSGWHMMSAVDEATLLREDFSRFSRSAGYGHWDERRCCAA